MRHTQGYMVFCISNNLTTKSYPRTVSLFSFLYRPFVFQNNTKIVGNTHSRNNF